MEIVTNEEVIGNTLTIATVTLGCVAGAGTRVGVTTCGVAAQAAGWQPYAEVSDEDREYDPFWNR